MYSIYFRWIEEYSLENVLIVVLINKERGISEEKTDYNCNRSYALRRLVCRLRTERYKAG